MSDKIDDGGPAFPHYEENVLRERPGMSLRDWFAGQALAGWLADGLILGDTQDNRSWVARRCYQFADAMLAARKGADHA